MYPENESPETSDSQTEEVQTVEEQTPTPTESPKQEESESKPDEVAETTETPPSNENDSPEEPVKPEESASDPSAESTPSEETPVSESENEPVTSDPQETSEPSPESPETKENAETTAADIPAAVPNPDAVQIEDTETEGVAHISAEDLDEDATLEKEPVDINESLLSQLTSIAKDPNRRQETVSGFEPEEFIKAIHYFFQSEDVLGVIGKVGIVKRSFDAIAEPIDSMVVNRFRTALSKFNKRRAEFQQLADVARAKNSQIKKDMLEKLKGIVDSGDVMLIQDVRNLQDEWKKIGQVLKADVEPLYKQFRGLLDQFYQQRSMHFQMLEYDRKINLKEKEKLILEAETLVPPEEERNSLDAWRQKMDHLRDLQNRWKAVGHVPREDMERINNAYRAVIDKFFEVRQGFMEIQDQLRQENADKKNEILAKMEPFASFSSDKPRDWNVASSQLREFQDAWKEIGQAPQSINGELWAKYREICNQFFSRKSEYFKQLDSKRAENLVKKRELCERAEALAGNSDWERSAKELKKLQKEWREIGPVPERHSNKLWNRFRSACDAFFEARRAHYSQLHEDENENLEAKKALIEAVKKLNIEEMDGVDSAVQAIKSLQAKWKEIGKVPFKVKDTIWEEFRGAIDAFFESLSGKREEFRSIKMKSSIDSIQDGDQRTRTIRTKISRLRRKIQQTQEKVDKYSTNIQYIAKGKSGDSLRNQIQKEIDKEVRLIDEWKRKIRELNDLLKNPPKEPEAEAAAITEEKSSEAEQAEGAENTESADQADAGKKAEASESAEEPEKEETAEPADEKPVEEEPAEKPETTEEAASPEAQAEGGDGEQDSSADEAPKEEGEGE